MLARTCAMRNSMAKNSPANKCIRCWMMTKKCFCSDVSPIKASNRVLASDNSPLIHFVFELTQGR